MAQSESVDLLLLGRSGNGKSATGNSILGVNYFKINRTTSCSVDTEPRAHRNTIEGKTVRVVDGVDLGGDGESLIGEQIRKAMSLINNSVSALLIIVRCDLPFSKEETSAIGVLKQHLGKDIIKNFGICIVTRGESFLIDEEEKKLDFDSWCKKGEHKLHGLFKECSYRCVLISNNADQAGKENPVRKMFRFVSEISEAYYRKNKTKKFVMPVKAAGHRINTGKQPVPSSSQITAAKRDLPSIDTEVTIKMRKDSLTSEEKSARDTTQGMSFSPTSQVNRNLPSSGGMIDVLTTSNNSKETRDLQPCEREREDPQYNAIMKDTHATGEPGAASSSDSVNILLFGSTGNGKSATGNSILGKPVFKISTSTTSSGRSSLSGIVKESNVIEGVSVSVIDGPGVYDSGEMNPETLDHLINSVEKSMELCGYNFCALLIVLRFGVRFTKQEVETIKVIKSVLGENVIKKYGICIITNGDSFDHAVEEAEEDGEVMTFKSWCRDQQGDVKNLFEECEFRCVLFDNKAKDSQKKQSQLKELMALIDQKKKYSNDEFLAAGDGLKELTLKAMAPQTEQDIRDCIKEIQHKLEQVDSDDIENVEHYTSRVKPLLHELNAHKERLQSFGHEFTFVDQLSYLLTALEMKIQSKINQRKLLADTRKLEDASSNRVSSMLNSKMTLHDDFMDRTELDRKTVRIDADDEARRNIRELNKKLAFYVENIAKPGQELSSVSDILDELLALKMEIEETITECKPLSQGNKNVAACSNLTGARSSLAADAPGRYDPYPNNLAPSYTNHFVDLAYPQQYNQDPAAESYFSLQYRGNTQYLHNSTSDIKTEERWTLLRSFINVCKIIPEYIKSRFSRKGFV